MIPRLAHVSALAVIFALLSAAVAAMSTSLQHQAAELAPSHVSGTWALLRHLARRPRWLLGQVFGVVTVVFHALALNFGPITLVQPLVVSSIVMAVPLRAGMERRLPGLREMGAVLLAAGGLAVFLVVSAPSAGHRSGLGATPLLLVTVWLAVGAAALTSARWVRDRTRRAFLLGSASGIYFALVAVLLKMLLDELPAIGIFGLLRTWSLYALLIAGLGGVLGNQLAYRSARLSSSMPVLNVVDVLLAVSFGYLLFHEVLRHSAWALVLEGLAALAMLTGLWSLAKDAATGMEADSEGLPKVPDPVS